MKTKALFLMIVAILLISVVFAQVEVKPTDSSKLDSCVNACLSSKRCIFTQEYPGREPSPACLEENIKKVCTDECSQNSDAYKPYVPPEQKPILIAPPGAKLVPVNPQPASPTPSLIQKKVDVLPPTTESSSVASPSATETITRVGSVVAAGQAQANSEQRPAEVPQRAEPAQKAEPGVPAPKVDVDDQTTRLLGIVLKLEETSIGLEQTGKRLDTIGIYYAQNDQMDKANAFFEAKKQVTELSQELLGLKDLVKENIDDPEKVYPLIKERTQQFKAALKEVVIQLLKKI
ncbi:hypothetical protein HZA97_06665 [Candidatus Woesearchaeota archaeon]|nr:hypothetical protein [Candidatus Woesearchaeota archaeon]